MQRRLQCLAFIFVSACLATSSAQGQFAGSRAGLEVTQAGIQPLPALDRKTAESYITIDGRAEIRVRPTEIRVVLALTTEGATAKQCQQSIDATAKNLKVAWGELGIEPDKVVEDFIAVLRVYEWDLQKRGDVDLGVEKESGFRMQSNIHLAVPDDATAMKALTAAFEENVTDIIAFDYWSSELDDIKVKVRTQAIQAATDKSDVLLAALFDAKPPAINIQEQTTIRYPESLYHSFVNSVEQSVTPTWRRDIPFIRAHRPRNTYYRGLYTDGDVQPRELPMRPEISVISAVRLYFQSPAAKTSAKVAKAKLK